MDRKRVRRRDHGPQAVAGPPCHGSRRQWRWGAAAYWRAREPASPRIHSFVLPPEHSVFRTLGEDAGPATLSPDGRRLAFTAARDGKVQLWVRPLDSPVAQPLAARRGGLPFLVA